jgi:hypothetical protein
MTGALQALSDICYPITSRWVDEYEVRIMAKGIKGRSFKISSEAETTVKLPVNAAIQLYISTNTMQTMSGT